MRGHRRRKTGSVFAGIRCGVFFAGNNADAGASFVAVERSLSDRLLTLLHPVKFDDIALSVEFHRNKGSFP